MTQTPIAMSANCCHRDMPDQMLRTTAGSTSNSTTTTRMVATRRSASAGFTMPSMSPVAVRIIAMVASDPKTHIHWCQSAAYKRCRCPLRWSLNIHEIAYSHASSHSPRMLRCATQPSRCSLPFFLLPFSLGRSTVVLSRLVVISQPV